MNTSEVINSVSTVEYARLKARIKTLEDRIMTLENADMGFDEGFEELVMENQRIAMAHEQLVEMNELLRGRVRRLKEANHDLHDERRELLTEIKLLRKQLHLERAGVDDAEIKGMK